MDYAKLSEKCIKSFNFIPMEDLETHQTTNVVVNDPDGNSTSQLHQDLQDEKVPDVYQFQSQDNRVYSDYITMLPTEDIIAQFHKQPHEIHFGGTDYQHHFNEKYEYSAPYPTEDHARAIKNAKLVTSKISRPSTSWPTSTSPKQELSSSLPPQITTSTRTPRTTHPHTCPCCSML